MFQLMHQRTQQVLTIYGTHKSGPQNEQTKFLAWWPGEGWRWAWACEFRPATTAATKPARRTKQMRTRTRQYAVAG